MTSHTTGRSTFDSVPTRHNIARILAALVAPQTCDQLSASLHMSDRSIRRYVAHLRKLPNRLVRVKSWVLIDGHNSPMMELGHRRDAPMPMMTDFARNARYRAAVKADPERKDRASRRDVAAWSRKRAVKFPQNPFSALFGTGRAA